MVKCSYCNTENSDKSLFCEECGRPLKKIVIKEKSNKKYEAREAGGYFYISPLQIENIVECEDYLQFPEEQIADGNKWKLIFKGYEGASLAEYLIVEEHQDLEEYIEICQRILLIFEVVQKNNLIVGSCDLEDFFVIDNDIEKMVLRIARPLLNNAVIPDGYLLGEFAAPEVRNNNVELLHNSTDVYLAAIIFNRLILQNKYSAGNLDMQLFWGYMLTSSIPFKGNDKAKYFHHFLGSSLNMHPDKRMINIIEAKDKFRLCSDLENIGIDKDLSVEDFLTTDVGISKRKMMLKIGRKEAECNEDSIESWKRKVVDEEIRAYLLADGISTCDIGSGYIASNIIKDNFKLVLDEKSDDFFLNNIDNAAEEIIYKIIEKSNKDIYNKACEDRNNSGIIMGSTLIFILIAKSVVYYYSLGDSFLFLLRKEQLVPLNEIDNSGIFALKRGITYSDFRQMEGKDNLCLYVGGEYARKESDYYKERKVKSLKIDSGDILVAFSDGVIDYISDKPSNTNWDRESILLEEINKQKPINEIATEIIKKNNKNGGGDNLSIILIKIGDVKNG